jgi:hypothetical protein
MEAESEPGPGPGVSDRYDKTSPWPVVVVLGIVLSEVGILFNLYPVSVTGLLLFAGSVAGIVHEAGYVARPWRLLVGLGGSFVVVGLLVVASQVDGGVSAFLAAATLENGIVQRGYTIAATGALATLGGLLAPRAPNQ